MPYIKLWSRRVATSKVQLFQEKPYCIFILWYWPDKLVQSLFLHKLIKMCEGGDLCECVVQDNHVASQNILSPTIHDHVATIVIVTICSLVAFTEAVTQVSYNELLNQVWSLILLIVLQFCVMRLKVCFKFITRGKFSKWLPARRNFWPICESGIKWSAHHFVIILWPCISKHKWDILIMILRLKWWADHLLIVCLARDLKVQVR